MAVGRSKLEIVLQFLVENILVAIPAVAASLGLTSLLADKVGSYLVSRTATDVAGLSVTIHSADIVAVYGIGVLILISAVLFSCNYSDSIETERNSLSNELRRYIP